MLSISGLTYRIGSRLLFDNASATVQEGWKVGLVGPNGAGKSTLLKLILSELTPDGGELAISPRASVGAVRQDIPHDNTPLLDIVLQADVERTGLLHAAETETDPYKLADIHTRLNDIDAYAAPAKASTILAGLGFKESDLSEPISSFSGGWRMRVALAGALFRQPDLLLLDEPTNHLDLEAVMWLENYLATYPKTLLVISHDRELLNRCTSHILHVEAQTLTTYTGNYDTFEKERAEKRLSQQKLHEKQKAQQEHMRAFVERFRAKASKARQAQSRLKALEKMTVVDAVMADRTTKFTFTNPEELPPPLITFHQVSVGYQPGHPILTRINERLDMDDRIALLGANGNGKSTLIKLLADKLAPQEGSLEKSSKLRIGYFSQHQTDELDVSETPYQAMNRLVQKAGPSKEAEVRGILGRFGFGKDLADTPIGNLSGGEKSRLLFAFLSHQKPHLLLLDEPTNHLDMDAREALVQALNMYEGAVVIVSHDPSMVERVADRLWLVAGGTCTPFEGDLAAYRDHLLTQRRNEKRAAKAESSGPSKKERQKQEAEKRKAFPHLVKAMDKAEKHLISLGAQRKKMEQAMASADLYNNPDALHETQRDYGRLLRDIDDAEADYLQAIEAFETAE